jgi:CRP-like cAMP-binding protein
MSFPEAIFKIIKAEKCPYYELGDELNLSGNALFAPAEKPTCVILVLDITEMLLDVENLEESRLDKHETSRFKCSGCTGNIWLEYKKKEKQIKDNEIGAIAGLLSNFSFFQILDDEDIADLVPLLKVKKFEIGEIVIKKGDPGKNLFIVLFGRVEVVGDDGISIAFLGKGEVFGEMSLLSGDLVGATIKVAEPSTILYLNGIDFRKVLQKFPSLQMYFARLLARRLAKTNVGIFEELGSGMVGRLSEMPPVELVQTLNQTQKTGVLTLHLSKGSASVLFRDGELIRARYGEKKDSEAFFEILGEKGGRFKFIPGLPPDAEEDSPVGEFMSLLMEGLNRIDEADTPSGS